MLWELRLVIEFPHASTIFIPSASFTHSNTPVARGESRLSFAQYCAGRIFQFIDNGFRTEKVLKQEDYPAFKQQQAEKPTRWSKCISLLSTLEELDIQ